MLLYCKEMQRVISIVNQKGGTGKTTTAVNFSVVLAELGKKVLLVDFDPQGNASSGIGVENGEKTGGIYEVLTGEKNIKEVVKKSCIKNVYVLPASQSLAGASIELVSFENREFRLKSALEILDKDFDFVLIDCPPSLGLLTINSLVASNFVMIPVQCEYYALEGLGQLLQTIELVKENLQPKLEILGVLLTMHDKRIKLSSEVVKEVQEKFPYRVFESIIPRNVRLAEAPSFGKSVLQYASWSKGARAYRRLGEEILDIITEINSKSNIKINVKEKFGKGP